MVPALVVSLVDDNVEKVEAADMRETITGRSIPTDSKPRQVAINFEKLTTYRYQPDKPAGENIFRFNEIHERLESLGVQFLDDHKVTILLASLPGSWKSFKRSFTAREESEKTLQSLIAAIESQPLQTGGIDTNEVTASFSRMNASGGKSHQ